MTNRINQHFFTFPTQIFHVVSLPVFLAVFLLAYKPDGVDEFLSMDRNLYAFNLTILTFIIGGSLVLTRLPFFFLRNSMTLSYQMYTGWCLLEIFIQACFCALYLTLMVHGSLHYFQMLAKCLQYLLMILWIPYSILALSCVISGLMDENVPEEIDESLIKFHDEYQKMKFAISASAILYIEAKENYVEIYYVDGNRIRNYRLRSSMKRLEEILSKHGLIRCQRAYYVNPAHVKVLRRDGDGFIYADLDTLEAISIPVSKSYYDRLSSIL